VSTVRYSHVLSARTARPRVGLTDSRGGDQYHGEVNEVEDELGSLERRLDLVGVLRRCSGGGPSAAAPWVDTLIDKWAP
jgi:hypothetical protein